MERVLWFAFKNDPYIYIHIHIYVLWCLRSSYIYLLGIRASAAGGDRQVEPAGDRPRPDALTADRVEDLVAEYLRQHQGLEILTERHLGTAVREFVEKEEKDAIKRCALHYIRGEY